MTPSQFMSGALIPTASAQTSVTGVASSASISAINFKRGRLAQTDTGQGIWTEYDTKGVERYQFNTVSYDGTSLTLKGRKGNVRLIANFETNIISGEWPGHVMGPLYTITSVETKAETPAQQDNAAPIEESFIPSTVPPNKFPENSDGQPPVVLEVLNPSILTLAKYKNGSFEKVSGTQWVEKILDGRSYNLVKLGHDGESIFLYDTARSMLIELDLADQLARSSVDGAGLKPFYPLTELRNNQSSAMGNKDGEKTNLSYLESFRCLTKGGKVERAGLLRHERCTMPYEDGGNICLDSSNCDGKCIASAEGTLGDTVSGVCQVNDNPFGCYAEVIAGKKTPTLCVD